MSHYTSAELHQNPFLAMEEMYENNPYYQTSAGHTTLTQDEATQAAKTGVSPDLKVEPTWAKTPLERIKGHYAPYLSDKQVPGDTQLDLSTEEGKLKAMGMLTQQGNDSTHADAGPERCGTTSLLAAAMYGGGAGLTGLIDSIEAYKQKGMPGQGGEPDEAMKKLKEKILDGKEPLSMADMNMMSEHMYKFFSGDVQHGKIGMNDDTMRDFIKKSPAMAKLFKDKDMQIDVVASHMILGIGHSDDKNGLPAGDPGRRAMIYDPWARAAKKFNAHGGAVVDDSKQASQVVTDPTELLDYHTATRKTIDASAVKDVDYKKDDWWQKTKDMYQGMY